MKGEELIAKEVDLAPLTSWRVGGKAEFFCSPRTIEELEWFLVWAHQRNQVLTVLGGGSNVLVSDDGVSGLVLSMRLLAGIDAKESGGHLRLTVMAGTHKSQLLRFFLQRRLAPALFLSGLPGDVGGGVAMNAGVSEKRIPREFCEIVDWVEVMRIEGDKPLRVMKPASEIVWSYRHSSGWQPGVITRVGVTWPNHPDEDIPSLVKEVNRIRLSKQPLDLPSGGSVFMNPPGEKPAGALIDECGFKGFTIGGARVSDKHANFIVNVGGATAKDIHSVIQEVKKGVLIKTGVPLSTEVVYLGNWT